MQTNTLTLRAENLTKSYNKRQVVGGVSFEVRQGEVVGLLGPNGAGKTTSFYMMVGLVRPDSGRIFLENENLTALPIHRRAHLGVGYLPQEPSIFRKLTVEDNLRAVLETQFDYREVKRRTNFLLEEMRIEHIRHTLGMSVSGGERRRVEIARALALEPKFILLDEPFAGVDPISVGDIRNIIRHLLDRGLGVLITDHSVRETLSICQRAYVLSSGKVIAEGNPAAIAAHAEVRRVYLGDDFRF